MKSTPLHNSEITEEQYAVYQDYKAKQEEQQKKSNNFEARFYNIFNYLVSIGLLVFTLVKSGLTKSIYLIYINDGLWMFLLSAAITLVVSALIVYVIKLLTAPYITAIASLLKLHIPFKSWYDESQPTLKREPYFETIEKQELQILDSEVSHS